VDGAVTRVLVTRHPTTHHHDHGHDTHADPSHVGPDHGDHGDDGGLAGRLQALVTLLPPALGGGPTQPLEVGRTTRVVTAAQRTALAVRDAAVSSPTAPDPWPGAKPTICATGSTAAPPTWTTWP
jgi:hypothetical protein